HELKSSFQAASNPAEAMEFAGIVITATDAKTPVFDGRHLREGTHITSIANGDKTRIRQEIDETTIRRADPIFITSKETVCANESDIFPAVRDRINKWERVHDIDGLLLGKTSVSADDRQITLFQLKVSG